jgi:hypothetical protein
MNAGLLQEGLAACLRPTEAALRRRAQSPSQFEYVLAVLSASALTVAGSVVADLSGATRAMDAALSEATSERGTIDWLMLGAVAAGMAVVFLIEWKPGAWLAAWLARLFGAARREPETAKAWIYLYSLVFSAYALAVMLSDILFGALSMMALVLAGWFVFGVALTAFVISFAVTIRLASVLMFEGSWLKAFVFSALWLTILISAAVVFGAAPVYLYAYGIFDA